ncbi:MAG: DUF3052 family protein [Chloroflexota bacterium]
MAKTLAEKMYIKSGYKVTVINAPDGYINEVLAPLPDEVTIVTTLDDTTDMVQIFVTQADTVAERVEQAKHVIADEGAIWLCYPKGGAKAKVATDLNRDSLAEIAIAGGLKPNRQVSLDDTWSGLRFGVVE